MKPILIASAVALAAPAFAQYPTTEQVPPPPATGATPAPEMAPTQTPTTTVDEHTQMKKDKAAKGKAEKDKTGTETAAPVEEMKTPAAPPATEATTTTATTATTTTTTPTPAAPAAGPSLAQWDFRGDMGKIGTANWGIGEHKGTGGAGATAMGGPIDVASQWPSMSPSGAALTPLEFGVWILDSYGQKVEAPVNGSMRSRRANLPAVQVLNVTAGALAEADTDGDWRVSREELTAFVGS